MGWGSCERCSILSSAAPQHSFFAPLVFISFLWQGDKRDKKSILREKWNSLVFISRLKIGTNSERTQFLILFIGIDVFMRFIRPFALLLNHFNCIGRSVKYTNTCGFWIDWLHLVWFIQYSLFMLWRPWHWLINQWVFFLTQCENQLWEIWVVRANVNIFRFAQDQFN